MQRLCGGAMIQVLTMVQTVACLSDRGKMNILSFDVHPAPNLSKFVSGPCNSSSASQCQFTLPLVPRRPAARLRHAAASRSVPSYTCCRLQRFAHHPEPGCRCCIGR